MDAKQEKRKKTGGEINAKEMINFLKIRIYSHCYSKRQQPV